MRKTKGGLPLFANLLISCLFSFFFGSGATGSQFLKLGIGARPVAMGGAYTAVSDDANAIFWNQAGLVQINHFEFTLMLMTLFDDVTYGAAGLVSPIGKQSAFAIGASCLTVNDVRRNEIGDEQGTFNNMDFQITAGYAHRLIGGLSLGSALKFIGSKLDTFSVYTGAVDAGILYHPLKYTFLGISLANIGPGVKFINEDLLPANLKAGICFKFPIMEQSMITIASDVSTYADLVSTISAGGEILYMPATPIESARSISLRLGYKSGYHLGDFSGISTGVGFEFLREGIYYMIDVVYIYYGYLGSSERISVSIRF
jgi:hypothetical protein